MHGSSTTMHGSSPLRGKSNPRTNLAQALDSLVDELIKGGGVEAILARNKYDPRPSSARKKTPEINHQLDKEKEGEVKSWPKIGLEGDE